MGEKYDFGGVATMYGTRCADGLTIHRGAFDDCDGAKVPLVWNHQHGDIKNVLGHAILENRGDDVYAHCKFNDTPEGQRGKQILANGDLAALSIYANQLTKKGKSVMHGVIREVSLVLAGANPGALIDTISIAHAMGYNDPEEIEELDLDEAYIYHGMDDSIDITEEEEIEESEENSEESEEEDAIEHASKEDDKEDEEVAGEDKTAQEIFDSMNDDQKTLLYAMLAEATGEGGETKEEDKDVKHNVFDQENIVNEGPYLSYEDRKQLLADAKRLGSLKEAIKHSFEDGALAHAIIPTPNYPHNADGTTQTYGIANIDWLFPDNKAISGGAPEFIKRDMGWVQHLMGSVHHTPFSRVKMMFADITEDEARARGYMKGKQKIEEVFTLLKRSFGPQTVYKKQKLDRDDIIDITDFDVVGWIREEMRFMLQEEIARAVLVGDGRNGASDDKIQEAHICPIWKDDDLYTIKVRLPLVQNETESARAKRIIKAAIKARKEYKGTGSPKMFTTADEHTEMLLLEDGNGYSLYKTDAELATKCRVSEIVEVPVMEGLSETVTETVEGVQVSKDYGLVAIIVNPVDYNIGTDRGGEVNTFEDFDIDYNQHKYLIETRISGGMVRPKAAIAIEIELPSQGG